MSAGVGYEMIIANSALRASLAIYHLISNTGAHGIIVNYPCLIEFFEVVSIQYIDRSIAFSGAGFAVKLSFR